MGTLKVIGAGLPRTGTTSLKAGLEQLLDGRCYHMFELMARYKDGDGMDWVHALDGDMDALDRVTDGWDAAVDWPTSVFWRELAERNPDAIVVLSHRGSADTWWESARPTVWKTMQDLPADSPFQGFNEQMRARAGLGDDWNTETGAKTLYDRHFERVTSSVPAERLVVWQPSDGWEPLCAALDLPIPENEFGHHNTRAEFTTRINAAAAAGRTTEGE